MIKIVKATPPPRPSQKGEGERLKRLDPRSVEILAALPRLSKGDAFDIEGTVREIARVAGSMATRYARENKCAKLHLRCVQHTPTKVRVFVV